MLGGKKEGRNENGTEVAWRVARGSCKGENEGGDRSEEREE